ncbi:MAG: tRNA pseudouridine(38-40) synthase TruA [Bacteroidota bacterium]|nr:tRNA pseudouridine(38-40) synthase TruA [Bacteroidota bacterium]MDP4215362.1 tRNA pseudouridine(38-40) synthase TruA [Bacteroidota bacterium]MDP4247338.1 tRNA pseudouridine(38-40) synthase TruA [Bacteroidota bacterium]MDP4253908.1 tRNA pseudouridine(38-40) synthase TruA [Bacteroidota bacterium]MDP4259922.1 tRNA pseudouridine(38-40) synthase TruA [Bacteroidota bacterium]
MPRYFIEVAYKGTNYSGFQVQDNAGSVQEEVEKALGVYFRSAPALTGSSRTDTGVHARQNFFHVDFESIIDPSCIYNINAILPPDIVILNITPVVAEAHCRFDAVSREYRYYVYGEKDPFMADRAYFFPYPLDLGKLNEAAALVLRHTDFTAFSKKRTQVRSFICSIEESRWMMEAGSLIYQVRANRFLRGMVRGLVGTMLQVGREKMSLDRFREILRQKDNRQVDFSVPGHGLFLFRVNYPVSVWQHTTAETDRAGASPQ